MKRMASPGSRWHDRMYFAGFVLAAIAMAWLGQVFVSFRAGEVIEGVWIYAFDDLWAYDYEAYVNAATRLTETGTLYPEETLSGPYRPGPYGLYMYSPILGVSLVPVTDLTVADSSIAWYVAHVLALVAACALMPVRPIIRVFAFVIAAFSFAVVRDMALGNVSVLLLLPLSMAWRWLDRPFGSIAQAVAISLRPMLGIVLIWQMLRRRWRAVGWTIGAGLVLVLVTLPFVGVGGYVDYLTVLRNLSGVTGVEHNYDLSSTALMLGVSERIATLILLSGYAIAVGAVLVSLRHDRELGFIVTVTASLLLSPLLWDHYLAMLVLPAAFLAQRGLAWGLLLPLASWLPSETYPLIVVIATVLPFLVPHAAMTDGQTPGPRLAPSETGQAAT
jgi:hypothetical protein